MTIPAPRIDLIPPAQPHKPASRYIFQVVEVGGQEEHRYYEDEDAAGKKLAISGNVPCKILIAEAEGGGTHKLLVRKYMPKM